MNSKVVIDFIARTPHLRQGVGQVVQSLDTVERATKRIRQALFAGGTAIGGALGAAGIKAAGFQKDMQNVNSIVQDSDKVFARTSASVLDLATKVPRSAQELAKGAYQIVSAGFVRPTQTVDILTQAGKAASAGLTTVDTAALALVTSLNAYGAAAGNATRVSDLLFQTVNVGQVSFEQLATNLGDFIGIAQASGATLAESLSAYASITVATGQASRSATSLQGIYRQLIKPSEELNNRISSLGFSSGKAMIQSLGLQGALEKLTAGMDTSAVARMFQDVEGLNGVLALTGPNAEKARANLAKFTNESEISGATQKALAEQAKGVSFQWDQLKSSLGAVSIEFGQKLLPFMKVGVGALNMLASGLKAIPGPIKTILVGMAAFSAFMGTVGITLLIWNARLRMVRIGMSLLGQTGVVTALMNFARSSTVAAAATNFLHTKLGLTTASMATFAKGIGVALAALVAVPMAARAIQNALTPQNINAMTQALLEWGDAGDFAGTRLVDKFGGGLQGLARDIEVFTTGNKGFLKSFNLTGVEKSVRRVDELDKAFAQLVNSGNVNMAKRQFDVLEKGLRSQGFTTAQINQAFNDYLGALAAIDLQARSSGDSQFAMADGVESVGEAMKRAEEDAKAYADRLEELQDQTRDFLSISGILSKVEDAHRSSFDAAEKARRKLEEQRDRTKEVARAQQDMARAQEKVNRMTAQQPIPGTKGWRDLQDAQNDVADAAERVRGSQAKVNQEYQRTAPSIAEITKAYQDQINKYKDFQQNLVAAAGRGVPIEVLTQLRGMGEEGVELASMLAKAPPAEFEKLKGVLAEKVRMEGEAFARALDHQLVVAAAIARKGAHATVEAILDEIKKIAPGIDLAGPDIQAALLRLGIMPIHEGTGLNVDASKLLNQPPAPAPAPVTPEPTTATGSAVKKIKSIFADSGGTIQPGFTLVENRTKLPEYILSAAQARAIVPRSSGSNSSTTTTTSTTTYQFGDIYAQDLSGAMRQADQKRRLGALAGG